MKEIAGITGGRREGERERKNGRKRRTKKGESLGTRKLEMITHLLNLYSSLLGLRRKKRARSFVFFSFFFRFF